MDNRTLGYLGLGAAVGIAVAVIVSQRERLGFCSDSGDDISDYRTQSGEGSETSVGDFQKHDEALFKAEVGR